MARKVTIDFELKYKEAVKNLDEFQKEYTKLEKNVQEQNEGVAGSIKNIESSSKKAAKGIKAIGTTLKAAGIGLIIAAFSKFKEVLEENQTVADGFSIVFETVSSVLNQVVNSLVKAYNAVSETTNGFDALGKVVTSMLKLAFAPLQYAFFGIKLGIQEAQLAWEESWLGDKDPETVKKLNASIEETKGQIGDLTDNVVGAATDIYDNFSEAVGEITSFATEAGKNISKVSISAALENSKVIVELRKQAELASAVNQGLIEKYDRQAESLRQLRDDDTKSLAERIAANEELGRVLEEQKKAMLANAQVAVKLAEYDVQKNNSLENQKALIEANNELAAIEAQITGFQSEQLINKIGLQKEANELTQTQAEADALRVIEAKQATADLIDFEVARLEAQKAILLEEQALEQQRLQSKIASFKEGTQARQDAENELLDFLSTNANAQAKIEKDLQQAKINAVMGGLAGVASLVGESSSFGKAIAITQAVIDTYTGANKALAQGGIFGAVAAAGVIASGIANVKKITSTDQPAPPSFATGASSSTPVATPTPPSFNVVGASDTNQLAGVIAGKQNEPVKAYVVSTEISTAQALDRNIVEGASI